MERKKLREEYFTIVNELNKPFRDFEFGYRNQLMEKAEKIKRMIEEAGK